jgi:hypothetical protein
MYGDYLVENKKLVQELSKLNVLKRRGQHIEPLKGGLAPLEN